MLRLSRGKTYKHTPNVKIISEQIKTLVEIVALKSTSHIKTIAWHNI